MILSTVSTQISNLGQSFLILAQGMLGIFIFMSIFYLLIYSLDKIFKTKDE